MSTKSTSVAVEGVDIFALFRVEEKEQMRNHENRHLMENTSSSTAPQFMLLHFPPRSDLQNTSYFPELCSYKTLHIVKGEGKDSPTWLLLQKCLQL